jgi:3-hydroxyacyl-CoA dehydrogenase/enoyl-CoA hydratase/3-hydroxybutyryl-CoA epimerase
MAKKSSKQTGATPRARSTGSKRKSTAAPAQDLPPEIFPAATPPAQEEKATAPAPTEKEEPPTVPAAEVAADAAPAAVPAAADAAPAAVHAAPAAVPAAAVAAPAAAHAAPAAATEPVVVEAPAPAAEPAVAEAPAAAVEPVVVEAPVAPPVVALVPPPEVFTIEHRDGVAIVRMDIPGEPVNTIRASLSHDFALLFGKLDREIASGRTRAVVFTSGKPDSFLAGADLSMLQKVRTAAEATELSRMSQRTLQRLEDLPVPVVAAIHGACLGGGLEVTLFCDRRIASESDKTVLGLPEVQLGLLPGGGGTQKLPRLIGLQAALDLLLTGKQLRPQRARKIGLIDEVVPESILLSVAVQQAQELADRLEHERRGLRLDRRVTAALRRLFGPSLPDELKELLLEDNPVGRRVIFAEARKQTRKKTRGHYPAPEKILDVVRIGLDQGIQKGLEAEAIAFGELVVSPQATQLIQLFFAQTALKKDRGTDDPSALPRPVRKVGVLGAGLMGAGIAFVTTTKARLPVRLRDKDEAGLQRGLRAVRELLDERVRRRALTPTERDLAMNMVSPTLDASGLANAEVVIEAVFEDLALKQSLLREIEAHGRPDVIFASNTSSLPIARIAEASRHPETVIGMHYFSPVPKMPLLEVIRTEATAPWVIATCVALGKQQGKTVIVVRDGAGFYTSRILAPYLNEAAYLLAQGVTIERIDRALVDYGFPVGPMALLDEVGIDVAHKVAGILHAAFGERLLPPPGMERLYAEGRHGRKSGRGFYRYGEEKKGGQRPVDEEVYKLLGLDGRGRAGRDISQEEIAQRCVLPLLNEAALCLAEGVLRSPRDGDIGAVFGLGFPPYLGGPFRAMDTMGIAEVVRRLEEYRRRHGVRFTPAPVLLQMARAGERFHKE